MSKANGRKSIFITGAASGMGRETAKLFAGKGWYVGGYDVNADGLKTLEQEIGFDNCKTGLLDVTLREKYRAALADFTARDRRQARHPLQQCRHRPRRLFRRPVASRT